MSEPQKITKDEAVAAYRAARDAYFAKTKASDEAFKRYFAKLQRGEKTNGATTRRLENEANYLSTIRYSAESQLYRIDVDPDAIDAADGITDTSYRYGGGGYG